MVGTDIQHFLISCIIKEMGSQSDLKTAMGTSKQNSLHGWVKDVDSRH